MTAPVSSTPRRAWIASTTGNNRQLFTASCSSRSKRSRRSVLLGDRAQVLLEDDLLWRGRTHYLGQPAEMRGVQLARPS